LPRAILQEKTKDSKILRDGTVRSVRTAAIFVGLVESRRKEKTREKG
jgi:hypothetical protein